MCQRSGSAGLVVSPTGSAAFDAGAGTMCHHDGLCISFRPDDEEISDNILKRLRQKLEWTVALIIADERSMMSTLVLSHMELHC
jgi:hypothetical protein